MPRATATEVIDELFTRDEAAGISLAFVAVRGGEVIAERYGRRPGNEFEAAAEVTAESTLLSWSMAKSITHAAVGLLVVDGLLDLDAPAPVPEWADTPKQEHHAAATPRDAVRSPVQRGLRRRRRLPLHRDAVRRNRTELRALCRSAPARPRTRVGLQLLLGDVEHRVADHRRRHRRWPAAPAGTRWTREESSPTS